MMSGRKHFQNNKPNRFNNAMPPWRFKVKKNKSGSSRRRKNQNLALGGIMEKQVFISEYISSAKGFRGILKSRFSDFHVNEIDCDGNVAILTDVSTPVAPCVDEEFDTNDEVEKGLLQLITAAELEQIKKIADTKCQDVVEVDVTEMSKEDRGNIHKRVKALFGKAVVGSTVARDEKKYIMFAAFNKAAPQDRRKKWGWPHPFIHFIMYKENVDTIQATSELAGILKCSPSAFAYAGTKDRRAKTSQWISIKLFDPSKIIAACKNLTNISVGNFCSKPYPLKLGQLQGNRFRIALRQLSADENTVRESLDSFRDNGFINYYGLQRFGNNANVPTYKIGIELLKGSWKEACDMVLKPREGDPWYVTQMRDAWRKTGNPQRALEHMKPNNKLVEYRILNWLASHTNDFKGALEHIPRNMRLLYYHAFQSLVWNKVVSRRIREFGCKLIPGDLVFVDKNVEALGTETILDEDVNDVQAETAEQDNESQTTESIFKTMVKPLSESDISSGQYTIFDIVLPLPGHDITYPTNECGRWIEETLEEYGLSTEKLKHKSKKDSLTGAYRKMFVKPEKLDWKIVGYDKSDDNLIHSDYQLLGGSKQPEVKEGATHKALVLDFQLPKSVYATMALREILKVDTSARHQQSLQQSNENVDNDENDEAEDNNSDDASKDVDNEDTSDQPDAKRSKLE